MKKEIIQKRLSLALKILLVLGMFISAFLIYEHFVEVSSAFCNIGPGFDCGVVNKSPYANIDGFSYLLTIDFGLSIPLIDISGINWFFDLITSNAFLGLMTLLFVLILVIHIDRKTGVFWIPKDQVIYWVRGVLVFGVVYGFYLYLIQHFVIQSYCIYCLSLDVILISTCIISFFMKNEVKTTQTS